MISLVTEKSEPLCSSGCNNIPVSLIKPIADILVSSPHTYIHEKAFHDDWKIGKVTPIFKTDQPSTPDQF